VTALSAITSGAAPALEATATSITINKCGAAQSTTAQQCGAVDLVQRTYLPKAKLAVEINKL